jgi:hypothetical protein
VIHEVVSFVGRKGLTKQEKKSFNITHAGVVELADAPDSKSGDPRGHAGSSPASGINVF